MSFNLDDANIGGQMKCGTGIFPAIGEGVTRVNGSAGIEGPVVMGNPTTFPWPYATVNIAPLTNSDNLLGPLIPGGFCYGPPSNPFSLAVSGPAGFLGNVETNANVIVGGNCLVQGNVISNCGGHVLAAKKNFDIPHPTKEGWRLRHTCPEGPSNDVYVRGRVTNKNEIILPTYWKELVDWTTITVNLTPIVISYEYDPLDSVKAKGWDHQEDWTLEQRNKNDIHELSTGIFGYKGRVHLHICKPICREIESTRDLSETIQKEILSNYHIWPTNEAALSLLPQLNPDNLINSHPSKYREALALLKSRSEMLDEKEKKAFLMAYARPLINKKKAKLSSGL